VIRHHVRTQQTVASAYATAPKLGLSAASGRASGALNYRKLACQ
jgi:hypothetical protein